MYLGSLTKPSVVKASHGDYAGGNLSIFLFWIERTEEGIAWLAQEGGVTSPGTLVQVPEFQAWLANGHLSQADINSMAMGSMPVSPRQAP